VQSLSARWSIQWYCKLQNSLPIFHVPSFYNKLHLVDALFARTQTSSGISQFTSASSIETLLSSGYYSHGSSFSHSVVANAGIYSKHLNSANEVVHLARCATQDLYNTDTSDMNKSQSYPCLLWVFLLLINLVLYVGNTVSDCLTWILAKLWEKSFWYSISTKLQWSFQSFLRTVQMQLHVSHSASK